MASSEFEEIYSRFYLRVKDYDMSGMTERLAKEMLFGYMKGVISKPYVRKLFSSIAIDEDIEEIEYELKQSVDEDSDKDFVEEVISLGMITEWISPRYHSTLLTNQMLSNSEQKFYSQAQQLAEMREMYTKAKIDLRKLIRDYAFSNVIINGA